jgi:hypothetical protein
MFPPIQVNPNMNRDLMMNLVMQSYGERRVVEKILQMSNNKVVSSKVEDIIPDNKEDTDNTIDKSDMKITMEPIYVTPSTPWWKNFTTRTAN